MNPMISTFIFSAALVGCIIAYPQFNPYSPIPPKFVPIGPSSPAPIRFAPAGPSSPIPVPIASRQYAEAGKDQNARVVSEYRDVNFDGTFNYGFESNNGIAVKTEGFINEPNSEFPEQVIKGSYYYLNKDNEPVNVNFIADKFGFRAEGDVIPKASPQILKSLEINAAAEAAGKIRQ